MLHDNERRILKIYNLNQEITNKDLYVKYGPVEKSFVDTDHRGMSLETATVKYRDHQSALKAIDELNRAELDGRIITVDFKPFGNESSEGRRNDDRRDFDDFNERRRGGGGNRFDR